MHTLICPHKNLFSNYAKNELSKKFKANFVNISQNKFNKIFHKYEIILLRHAIQLKYKENTKIKYIISPTTGVNHIDKRYFKKKDIKIIILRGELNFLKKINSTAEHAIFLILNLLRNNYIINKKNFFKKKIIDVNEIYNKKIGIIGYGRLGVKVDKILKAFGAITNIYDKYINKKHSISLKKVLQNSDILTIHIPLNDNNKNFLNKKKIELLKDNCIVINTSRGEIVDQKQLIKHIKKRNIKYGSDVLCDENDINSNSSSIELLKLMKKTKSVYITPHIGGLSKESIQLTDKFIIDKFKKFYEKTNRPLFINRAKAVNKIS